ncbi:5222_t:CDS:2 [Cetraspora pellucida]|uniref:5222_t:CDS:1 n=1 Tax=Cetraspora pellucida TaxID=1433469 RepID=A0A9N9GTS9_9GLOM|nr:5222_t:CDS:2 [Cetraspora pellucida]
MALDPDVLNLEKTKSQEERHPILKEGTTPTSSCITAKRPQDAMRGTTPLQVARSLVRLFRDIEN